MTSRTDTAKDYAQTHEEADDVLSAEEAHGRPAAVPWDVAQELDIEPSKEGGITPLRDKKDPE